jgi:hypothetical protein
MISVDVKLLTSTTGAAWRDGTDIKPSPMERCDRKISHCCFQHYSSHSVWRMSLSPISILGAPVASHETSAEQVAVTKFGLRNAHSHTVATRHPSATSTSHAARSRMTFAANFSFQNSRRVAGVVV